MTKGVFYDQTSLKNCKRCDAPLNKEKLKGNLCMGCHYKETKKRRHNKRKAAIERLGDKCVDCSKTYPAGVYDFHHLGNKKDCVGTMIRDNLKLSTILEEVDKCVLLCANCHRIRHYSMEI